MTTLQAEWTKLRSVRSTMWALLAIVGFTLAIGVVSASTSTPDVVPNEDIVTITLAGVYLAQIAAVALGVVAICGEYATGTIRATFMANPRRRRVLSAKAGVVGGLVLGAGAASALAAFYVGLAVLRGNGFTSANGYVAPSLADADTLRKVAVAAVYPFLIALLSLGVGTILRHTAPAISVVLGLLLVPYLVAALLPHDVAFALQMSTPLAGIAAQEQGAPGDPWAALGVTIAWTVGALVIALWVVARRDA
jgi:ABC-2 type transport system permease protein